MSTVSGDQRAKYLLYFFIGLAIIARVVVISIAIQYPERTRAIDSGSYLRPALALVKDGSYRDPSAIRTPLYPLFLAFLFSIFGSNSLPVVIAQVIVNALTLWLMYRLARLMFTPQEALIGILLQALALESTFATFFILTDVVFAFLLAISTYALYKYWQAARWQWVVIAARALGLGVLARPIAFLYPGAVMLILWAGSANWKQWLARWAWVSWESSLCPG